MRRFSEEDQQTIWGTLVPCLNAMVGHADEVSVDEQKLQTTNCRRSHLVDPIIDSSADPHSQNAGSGARYRQLSNGTSWRVDHCRKIPETVAYAKAPAKVA